MPLPASLQTGMTLLNTAWTLLSASRPIRYEQSCWWSTDLLGCNQDCWYIEKHSASCLSHTPHNYMSSQPSMIYSRACQKTYYPECQHGSWTTSVHLSWWYPCTCPPSYYNLPALKLEDSAIKKCFWKRCFHINRTNMTMKSSAKSMSILVQEYRNLSVAQKELLLWYSNLLHASLEAIHNICQNKWPL